jgi:hypothetical protein
MTNLFPNWPGFVLASPISSRSEDWQLIGNSLTLFSPQPSRRVTSETAVEPNNSNPLIAGWFECPVLEERICHRRWRYGVEMPRISTFCANDTENENEDQNYGELICVTDGTLDEALSNAATPEGQMLVVGHPELAMPDNLAYQPGRAN